MCKKCESDFSKFENGFKQLFDQVANHDYNIPELNISELSKKCIYSIAWRGVAREIYFPQENDFTEEELKKFPVFLNLLKHDIEDNRPKHNIHIIPCINKVLRKLELPLDEYFYKGSVNQSVVRIWDNWKRLVVFIHIPFFIIVVELIDKYSDKWIGTQIKDREILVIDTIERIPSFVRQLIQHFHHQFLEDMKQISTSQLNNIRKRIIQRSK